MLTGEAHRRAQARPGASILQRYYLDFVLVALAALLLWELNERGSAFQPSATGGVSSDPILLASPLEVAKALGDPIRLQLVDVLEQLHRGSEVSPQADGDDHVTRAERRQCGRGVPGSGGQQ